ncbi:toxin-antitoxin system YwqK family antitoxin [Roseivirga pacifica]|uniref:toxin-antitoxin system YwqK family antitoxin n=1 Tax=Roseivirga pacifica TaxID=1267423 RepID=UPI003BAFEB93
MRTFLLLLLVIFCDHYANSQQPDYSPKSFLNNGDTVELANKIRLAQNQSVRFISARTEVMDIDDNKTTHVKAELDLLLCIVGDFSKKLKNGKYQTFVFLQPQKMPVRIWEQDYVNDTLSGNWKTYNIEGKLVSEEMYEDNNLQGISRFYQIDGKTPMSEIEYSTNKIIEREYSDSGVLLQERPYVNGKLNGTGTRYYEDGTLMEEVDFTNSEFNGHYKYFYPNGKIWIETIYKNGNPWTVIGNYLPTGKERDAGTLKNGNGTLIYYSESGDVNEVHEYKGGIRIK